MSSIFSAISGHLTRSLVLGTLLPVIMFVVAAVTLFSPMVPTRPPLLTPLYTLEKEWAPWAVVLTTLAITGLLYNLNTPLIRLYEGYVWKDTMLGRWRTRRYRMRVATAEQTKRRLILMRRALTEKSSPDTRRGLQAELDLVARQLSTQFPGSDLVLPTRLGNVIRSFEEYPRQQYGISAISLWPRMTAAINKDYAAMIGDAKSTMDFAVNSSFLCTLLAGGLLASMFFRRHEMLAAPSLIIGSLLTVAAFVLLAYSLYLAAIARATEWGIYVKGAFDLYRRDLLKALGYEQQPLTIREERELWQKVSRQIIFGDPVDGEPTPFKVSPSQRPSVWNWLEGLLK
jgi:hypothetical protein